jgi:hypothetical protein
LLYVAKGRYKIKRMVKTERGKFWRDVGVVADGTGAKITPAISPSQRVNYVL